MLDKDKISQKWDNIIDSNWRDSYQIADSGETFTFDSGITLLPMAMTVASQTIGMDLLSVQPMSAPSHENEEDRLKRERLNKRISLFNKLNKIKEGEYEKIEQKPQPNIGSQLIYLDFKYGKTISKPKRLKRKKKNARN